MKNGLWLLAGTVAVVTAAACSSGGSSGMSGLTTGTYLVSNVGTAPSSCSTGESIFFEVVNGGPVDVVVSSTALTVGLDFVATNGSVNSAGGVFVATPTIAQWDFTTTASQAAAGIETLSRGYNCIEKDVYADSVTVTSKNHFHFSRDLTRAMVSGSASECVAAISSEFGVSLSALPCLTPAGYDAAK